MNDSRNLRAKFESIILDLLRSADLGEVGRENYRGWTFTAGRKFAVAVEYYYASLPQSGLVVETAAALARAAKRHGLHPVLVVSCELTEHQRSDIEERFDLTVMDRADLIITANRFKSILADLDTLGLTLLHKGCPRDTPILASPVAKR